jgi:S-adenosylmethionine-dependent methyltransferase
LGNYLAKGKAMIDDSDSLISAVEKLYDDDPQREWERMDRHRTEFAVTLRALAEHLPPPPAHILDCGGGPGRYAIELARQGYRVTLFDLSAGNLELARQKVAEAGVTLDVFERGSALDLSRYADESFDAVLLLGPLYHLMDEGQRLRAVQEAARVLISGGPLFAAFIARYAGLRDAARRNPSWVLNDPGWAEQILTTGRLLPLQLTSEGGETPGFIAHAAHPSELIPLLREAGLEVETVLCSEGMVSMIETLVNALNGPAWDAWADLNYRVAADQSLHSSGEHLLAVAVKPRWRAALRQVVTRLDDAGIGYKVVGGAALALHGIDVRVKDIDIETNIEDAYRFDAAFASNVEQPVALYAGDEYRSHFGRFRVAGVCVEVMGDLQRREGDGWTPSRTYTEDTIELDGVPVRVAWLEEETLANIRRNRLSRAALCLPHCDHARLLALLRGRQPTEVL